MKLLLIVGLLSLAAPARRDDPPPEPLDCPLCGGNADVHVRVLFQVERVSTTILFRALP